MDARIPSPTSPLVQQGGQQPELPVGGGLGVRQQQQAELQALLKRIDARRKEHIKQRNLDSKRLLQRNRNVQAVLESKDRKSVV